MLVAVQTGGTRPPLFMIHGLHGVMAVHRDLLAALGRDQPYYVIHARGFDGAAPPCATVPEMVAVYLDEIRQVWPDGPYIIGGICSGCTVAIEVGRELAAADQTVAPLLLIDPTMTLPRPLQTAMRPGALAQLRRYAESALLGIAERYTHVPYVADDPRQLARAVDVGVTTCLALNGYRPGLYYGPTELIVSAERAGQFFDPAHPWQERLQGWRTVHVLEGDHFDLMMGEQDRIRWLMHAFLRTALVPRGPKVSTESKAAFLGAMPRSI